MKGGYGCDPKLNPTKTEASNSGRPEPSKPSLSREQNRAVCRTEVQTAAVSGISGRRLLKSTFSSLQPSHHR
ncbi:hypothetical protein Hanom_Chr02g00124071 [Helianthus anomalus]